MAPDRRCLIGISELGHGGVKGPHFVDPFETILATTFESQFRSRNEVLYNARCPHLAAIGAFREEFGDGNTDSGDVAAAQLDFRCVYSTANLEIGCPGAVADSVAAADGASRSVKRRDEAIACRVDDTTSIVLGLRGGAVVKST